jgi:hypothetical protein
VGGQADLDAEFGALEPIVQTMGIAVHGGPTLQGKIRD